MDFGKRSLWLIACILGGALLCFGRGSYQDTQGDNKPIQVQVEMVSVPVVVMSKDGKRITDLRKEDFQVYEDKVAQEVSGFSTTEEPISVVLVLDTSGSMDRKISLLQYEAIRFTSMLKPEDQVAVLSFSDEVRLLQDFTSDRERIASGIRRTRAGGGTALYEAVQLALDQILKPVRERKAVVLFTDGVDTVSRRASRKSTLRQARECGAGIYTIYFDTEADFAQMSRFPGRNSYPTILFGTWYPGGSLDYVEGERYLQDLAHDTGGVFYSALTATDLGPDFEEIARELRSQYSIGYYPLKLKHDGKFHAIQVKVDRPGAVVRTRKGYVLPK